MLIPIRHENMSARRWPVITFALIAINVVVFLATFHSLQDDMEQLSRVKLHIMLLAAAHPELNTSPEEQEVIHAFRDRYPKNWEELANPQRPALDAWDRQMQENEDAESLQGEMDSLATQLHETKASSLVEKYAFVPAHPSPISYLTANFLH